MQCTQEEHDKQKRRYHHLTASHFHNKTIKTRAEWQNGLVITLELVEDRKERGECVINRIRTPVIVEGCQHLKTTTVVDVALIFEKEEIRIIHTWTLQLFKCSAVKFQSRVPRLEV